MKKVKATLSSLIINEVAHGEKISGSAEDVWGWSSASGQVRATRRAQYFIALGGIVAQSKALEVGCGTGLFTAKVYAATQAQIMAIDISPALLEQARQKLPCVDFRVDNAMALSFGDASFDVVYGSSVLHHLEMLPALQEFYRVTRPGGKLVFAEPNMLNPQILVQKNVPFIKKWMGDSPDETAIVRWKMKKMLRQVGYRSCCVFPYDFLHPAVPKPLIGVASAIGSIAEKIPLLKEIAGSVIIYAEK